MAALQSLEQMLAARTLWHAGRSARSVPDGEPTGLEALDALLPQRGWPRRALTELLLPADGVGEMSLLLPTLARLTQAGGRVALVSPPYLPYAPAWQAAGVDLAQLQLVQAAPRDALWAFEQCLRSGACEAVLGWPATADAQALRRLQVAADSGDCLGFALRDRRHAANPSPAALRLEAVREEGAGIAWRVRKCRGGPVPAATFVPRSMRDDAHAVACPGPRPRVVPEEKVPARSFTAAPDVGIDHASAGRSSPADGERWPQDVRKAATGALVASSPDVIVHRSSAAHPASSVPSAGLHGRPPGPRVQDTAATRTPPIQAFPCLLLQSPRLPPALPLDSLFLPPPSGEGAEGGWRRAGRKEAGVVSGALLPHGASISFMPKAGTTSFAVAASGLRAVAAPAQYELGLVPGPAPFPRD